MMTINQAPMHTKLIVRSFHPNDTDDLDDIQSRLMLLGFLAGEMILVTKKAPLFQEPLLVEVRGRSVAMSLREAEMVEVEVVP